MNAPGARRWTGPKKPTWKSERQRRRAISLRLLVTGAADHVGAAALAKGTHKFLRRGKNWLEEDVSRLYAKQPVVVGAVANDRGRLGDDLLTYKPGVDWSRITAEFFLP